jgi:UDP-N-acetylglucosamine 1-carboxyvinyltransferase
VTDGEVFLEHARADLLGAAVPLLAAAGVVLEDAGTGLIARRSANGLTGIDLQTCP